MDTPQKRGSYVEPSPSGGEAEGMVRPRVKLARRIVGRTVGGAASTETLANQPEKIGTKMVVKSGKLRSVRGFTQTPEEGRVSRTSFTDAPLLRRVTKK